MSICPICGEETPSRDTYTLYTPDGPEQAHRVCMLRDVMGGIGHLIAHDYWCKEGNDPDAGLTTLQSARLVDAYYHIVGVKEVVSDDDEGVGEAGAPDRQEDGG